jgi:hypothetical protein
LGRMVTKQIPGTIIKEFVKLIDDIRNKRDIYTWKDFGIENIKQINCPVYCRLPSIAEINKGIDRIVLGVP